MTPEQARSLAASFATAGLVPQMYRHVEPAYPHEGCGFVFADGGRLYVLPTENRAQLLHEKDPARYPRGGADWFEPDMKPWLRASREGHTPRAIFHSHPDVGAYFSQGDHDSAVVVDAEGTVRERHPGLVHVVVSVRRGEADGAAVFRFNADHSAFVEVGRYDAAGVWTAASGDTPRTPSSG